MKRDFVPKLGARLSEDPRFIQIVLGPRQVGKTTGVLQLKELFDENEFVYLNADAIFSNHLAWFSNAWEQCVQKAKKVKKFVLVIDEIQTLPNWSEMIKSFWDKSKRENNLFHLVLLGSSSLELHQGLTESLAGRFELKYVPHWSFAESLRLKPDCKLEEYLEYGGYPELLKFYDKGRRDEYLRNSILEPVISKDILQNVTVKKPALFKQAFEVACLHGCEILSYNKFLGQLQEGGNVDLVKHYLTLYQQSYLIKTLPKFSTNKLQKKMSSPKLLPLAPAFMNLFGPSDFGRNFELMIGIYLLNKFQDVYYWRENNKEVDFIVKQGRKLLAIEVKTGKRRVASGLNEFIKHHDCKALIIEPHDVSKLDDLIIF